MNPSCKTYNISKGDHDPKCEPIVNPCQDDPKNYLCFKNYLYFGKDVENKGRKTIEIASDARRKQKRRICCFDIYHYP
jgi:hypothetical protein